MAARNWLIEVRNPARAAVEQNAQQGKSEREPDRFFLLIGGEPPVEENDDPESERHEKNYWKNRRPKIVLRADAVGEVTYRSWVGVLETHSHEHRR